MAWIYLPGIEGKVYQPETDPAAPRKRDCPDCFSCQMCCDSRCEKCRGQGVSEASRLPYRVPGKHPSP